MDTNLVFLVFTLYSLVQGGDLDIALCDARQWYLKSAAEGLFDGPLSGSQESVQYKIEDILLKSRNDPTKRQIDCTLLEQFEDILKKKSKGNEGDNGEAVNEMEIDETDILEEDIEHDETDPIEHNNAEENQEMDETNSLPDEVTHSSHLQSNSHGETNNVSEDRDSKNAEEMSNVEQSKEQNVKQEMTTEHNGEQFQEIEENEQNTIDQNSDQPKTTKQNEENRAAEYNRAQLQTTELNEEQQQRMGQNKEQPQTSEQNGANTQKEQNEEQQKTTEQSEHNEEEQRTTKHSVENQQTTEQIEEQTTNQSEDQKQTTEQRREQQITKHGEEQQQITEQGEKQQHITEQNEGQTQTTGQNVTQKKTTGQSEDQPQMMEQNSKTQTTERNDESQTTEQNGARPQAMEQNEFQSDYIDSIIADLFQAEDASEKDNAAKTGILNIEQTMSIKTQQNGEYGDSQTHALQDKAEFSDLTQEKEKHQEMQADKTVQTAEHLQTEMHEIAKGTEKHMEKETDKMMNTADFDQTITTEQHNDASSETNKIKPTDNVANTEHLQNVNDFVSESDYSDAEKEKNLQNFGVCNTDTSSVTDIFLSRYLPSIHTNNESTTEKCRDCHGFVSDYKNSDRASNVNTDMPDEFSDKDVSKHESSAPNKELGQNDNTHDKIDTVNSQNDNNKQSENIRTPDTHLRMSKKHTYSIKKDIIPSHLVPSNENTNDEKYIVNRENEPVSDNNLQQISVEPDGHTNDKEHSKEEIVNNMQDANFEHMKEFFKTKTLEYSSQIQNLEILVIKLQNQLLMEKLDKQNHSTSITRLENSILKLENELLRLNNSHYDLKIENEKMNRQKQKYLQLDHVPKNDSKAKEIADQTSKSYEIITQQQSKITQLAELLKNQSKAIQHMKTRYDYLEDQNRMLFQMVMNQTSLMTQIMSRVQELSDQNMQHRIEAQSLKEKLAMSKLSDKKENNHFSEVSNKLLEKIDAIVSDKKIDMTDDRKSNINTQETGKFGNEDEADEKLKDYINKTKKLADITYNWCGKHRMVCIYKSIRLSTCVPFVPLYWSVCDVRQTKDTTRPQMEYGYDRRKTVKQDLEELKEQIFNKVKANPSAEDPKDRNEEKADKNINNDDTKSHAFVQGSENKIVEISKQRTDNKPQTSDVDKKAIEENVETKPLKPTADESTKIKTTDTKTQIGNGESTEIKTSQQGVQSDSINSPKPQDSSIGDKNSEVRDPNMQTDTNPHENTLKPDIGKAQESLLTNSKPTTNEDNKVKKSVPKDTFTVNQPQDSKNQQASTSEGLPPNDQKENNSKSIKVQTTTGHNKESSEQKSKKEAFKEPIPNEKPVKSSQQENVVLKQDKIPDNKTTQKEVVEDKPTVKTSKSNVPLKKKSSDKQQSTKHKKDDNIKSQKLSSTSDSKITNQEKKHDDKVLDASKQQKKEVKETTKQHKNHKEDTLKEIKLRYLKNGQTEPKDCYDYYVQGYKRNSIYKIKPYGLGKQMQVYCDMKDGGWTLIQKRSDGTTKFFREWAEYKNGFGGLYGEHWLGNDYIHYLTNQDNYKLRIELTNWEKTKKFAEYDVFRVDDEQEGYKLTVSGYTGDAGDGMAKHNGHKFSTKDVDNDKVVKEFGGSCANRFSGAWWYYKCYMSNLNGLYYRNGQIPPKMFDGITWKPWTGSNYSLRSVEMKIRPYLAKDK